MNERTVGSLFTGCGGLDLGLHYAGWRTVWTCESDADCRRVLTERFPGVPVVDDVRSIDESLERPVLLAGGFPCPDFSVAGKRLMFKGERAKLWFAMAGAVRVLRPQFVLVENVPGLLAALGVVLADLAALGYVGRWFCVRAADVGAPHRRERLFIVARDASADAQSVGWQGVGQSREERSQPEGSEQATADADDGRVALGARTEGRQDRERAPVGTGSRRDSGVAWGTYEPAVRRWEYALGRPAPEPADDRGRLNPRFVEWMLGFPHRWVGVNGVSRTAQLRMLGNAVQVQVGQLVGGVVC